MVKFDFDLAWDAFEDDKGEPIDIEPSLRRSAKAWGCDITKINYHGPGGGNPNIFATAPSKAKARAFLSEVYGCRSEQDIMDYVEPVIDHLEG